MVKLNDALIRISEKAVEVLSRIGRVQAAYIFGSQTEGTARPDSDIDIAIFMEGVETLDIRQRALLMVMVEKECGDDVETHLFPASSAENPMPGSFADYIIKHGIRV